jgi:hypothetical protein
MASLEIDTLLLRYRSPLLVLVSISAAATIIPMMAAGAVLRASMMVLRQARKYGSQGSGILHRLGSTNGNRLK